MTEISNHSLYYQRTSQAPVNTHAVVGDISEFFVSLHCTVSCSEKSQRRINDEKVKMSRMLVLTEVCLEFNATTSYRNSKIGKLVAHVGGQLT